MKKTLVSFLIVTAMAPQAWAFNGTVSGVRDGDTVTVSGKRVRLFGIDAPELSQPGGEDARDFLASHAQGRTVRVEKKDRDDYGRVVGVVLLPDGTELNALMVKSGHAWVYTKYCRDCYGLQLAQAFAKARKLGLWAGERPVPPWKWRKSHGRRK